MGAPNKDKALIVSDLILPILGVLLACYYVWSVSELPWIAQSYGWFVAAVLVVLTLVLVTGSIVSFAKGTAVMGLRETLKKINLFEPRRIGLIGLIIGFIAVVPYFGFTLTVLVFLILAMYLLGVRDRKPLLGLSFTVALVGYLFFVAFLNIPLPEGPIERLLGGLF